MGCLLKIILFISIALGREVRCAHVLLTRFLKRKTKVIQVTYTNKNLVFPTSLDRENLGE